MASPDVAASLPSAATLAADLVPLFIRERTLMLSERKLIFHQFGDREMLPEGQGKTIQFTRYERLVLPTLPLTEGNTPSPQQLTTAIVQAVPDQWGGVVALTDVGQLTVRHPVLRIAQDRIATQHTETVDREIQLGLMGGTNVIFANGRPSRSTMVAGDNPTTDLIRQIVANLRNQGAPSYEGGHYVGVLDPFMEMDLTKVATFVNASSYSNIRSLYNGEVGMWMGVRWMVSNFLPIIGYQQAKQGTSTGDALFTQSGTVNDTTPVVTVAYDTTTTVTGFTKLGTAGNLTARATRIDPQSGQEVAITAAMTLTVAAAGYVRIGAAAGYVNGTYNIYCSLQGSAIPVYQVTVTPGALTGSNTVPPTICLLGLGGAQNLAAGTGTSAPQVV